jgi:hypothetical protein
VILPAMLVLLGGTAWWSRGKSASLSDPAANGVEREPARVG